MNWKQPFVRCPNSHSTRAHLIPIVLPYPNPPDKHNRPPDWPLAGWKIKLICQDCGRWRLYGKADVLWGDFLEKLSDRKGQAFWRIEIECAEANCKSRDEWHLSDSRSQTSEQGADFVLNAISGEKCANGHPFHGATVCAIETVSEV